MQHPPCSRCVPPNLFGDLARGKPLGDTDRLVAELDLVLEEHASESERWHETRNKRFAEAQRPFEEELQRLLSGAE